MTVRARNYVSENEQLSHGTLNPPPPDSDQPDGGHPEQSEGSIAGFTNGLWKNTVSSHVSKTRH
jgi:hypothetical protein